MFDRYDGDYYRTLVLSNSNLVLNHNPPTNLTQTPCLTDMMETTTAPSSSLTLTLILTYTVFNRYDGDYYRNLALSLPQALSNIVELGPNNSRVIEMTSQRLRHRSNVSLLQDHQRRVVQAGIERGQRMKQLENIRHQIERIQAT